MWFLYTFGYFDRGVQPGTIMLDSSTIDPSVSKELAVLATNADTTYMDAPVSGGN